MGDEMRVPTAEDTGELRRIVEQACGDAKVNRKGRFFNEPVNWRDLRFGELETTPRVTVKEASPNAHILAGFVQARLNEAGFDVDVETEW